MVRILIKKYKTIGWDIENWKNKKNKFKEEIDYDLNKLMILNWILGRLNKKGNKAWSFYIIINVLLHLKKNKNELPINILNLLIIRIKQNVLLFNKKKGTLRYELPRFVTIEQGIKKVIEWLIKAAVAKNKNIIHFLYIKKNPICMGSL